MGPVIQALQSMSEIESLVCTTGQHRPELVHEPLALFGVVPRFDLKFRIFNSTPDRLLVSLLPKLGAIVSATRPDWLMAAGDTTSAMCAGLTAVYQRVRFAHVEAGLRTRRMGEPFPEEFHRRVSAVAADLHFAPNAQARSNLIDEAFPRSSIVVTGNPIVDALNKVAGTIPGPQFASLLRRLDLGPANDASARKLLLVTFHRRENIGKGVANICAALRKLAVLYPTEISILCLVHPNPRINEPARRLLGRTPNIVLSSPVDYPTTVALLKRTALLLTDSGGLQEEAPYLRVPVLVLREVTERPEGVKAGVVKLVGTDVETIVRQSSHLIDSLAARKAMIDPDFSGYGDGHASGRIVAALLSAQKHSRREDR